MEDPCSLEIDSVGGGRGQEEEQNTVSVTMRVETMCTNSHTSGTVDDEEVVHRAGHNLITPEVGMTFDSEEKAYEMYNTYAGKVGFSVRKSKTRRRQDGTLFQKSIVCSSQGFRQNESSQKDITRTGCDARVQFGVSREGIWTVNKVVLEHNHYLASPNKAHKLRSQRQVIEIRDN